MNCFWFPCLKILEFLYECFIFFILFAVNCYFRCGKSPHRKCSNIENFENSILDLSSIKWQILALQWRIDLHFPSKILLLLKPKMKSFWMEVYTVGSEVTWTAVNCGPISGSGSVPCCDARACLQFASNLPQLSGCAWMIMSLFASNRSELFREWM